MLQGEIRMARVRQMWGSWNERRVVQSSTLQTIYYSSQSQINIHKIHCYLGHCINFQKLNVETINNFNWNNIILILMGYRVGALLCRGSMLIAFK